MKLESWTFFSCILYFWYLNGRPSERCIGVVPLFQCKSAFNVNSRPFIWYSFWFFFFLLFPFEFGLYTNGLLIWQSLKDISANCNKILLWVKKYISKRKYCFVQQEHIKSLYSDHVLNTNKKLKKHIVSSYPLHFFFLMNNHNIIFSFTHSWFCCYEQLTV